MIYTHRSGPKRDPYEWHRWFAWHPVTFHSQGRKVTVWLSFVARRCKNKYLGMFEYRVLPFHHLVD